MLCTGDTVEQHQALPDHRLRQWRGHPRHDRRATTPTSRQPNDDTKIVVGHGPLAKKSDVAEFRAMLVTARDRIEKLVNEGKSEAEVVAAKPLADLDAKWAAS